VTPAARVQTSIELLDTIIASARAKGAPADRILADWFRNNRFAGSKDRRAIRALVYAAIRVCGPVPASGRAAMLRLAETDGDIRPLFDGGTLRAFAIAVAHWSEVGGSVAGSIAPNATEIYQEGIRFPGIRVCRDDELISDIVDLIRENFKADIVEAAFIMELNFLNGREKLKNLPIYSLIQF